MTIMGGWRRNNGMQRTAFRAAAEPGRSAALDGHGPGKDMNRINQIRAMTAIVLLATGLIAAAQTGSATISVDCSTGGAVGPMLGNLKSGDVVFVHGTCRENLLIQPELQRITIDGQGKATIHAADSQQPAIQVLGREVTIRGFTVTGGFFGVAINRGATAVIENNTIANAAHSGIEVSQNSFARIINNTIEHNQLNGIFVLGSSSVHIGVLSTGDTVPSPNLIRNNGEDGIKVLRASTARIIGNTLGGNRSTDSQSNKSPTPTLQVMSSMAMTNTEFA